MSRSGAAAALLPSVEVVPNGHAASDGAAALLQMVIAQGLEANPGKAALLGSLRVPVVIALSDSGGTCTVSADGERLVITAGAVDRPPVCIEGVHRHLLDVTQIRIAGGGWLPVGLVTEARGRAMVADLLRRKLRIRGLLRRYRTVSHFLALVNIND